MTNITTKTPISQAVSVLAAELSLPTDGIAAVLRLLDEGNTVPFIARYRKEATNGLDEVQIRAIEERHAYYTELEARRETILTSIEGQGKLTEALRRQISVCKTKSELEDLYLPYKPKRRTRATIARSRGLEPLALRILEQPAEGDPLAEALVFVSPEGEEEQPVPSVDAALAGARDIVAETVAEQAAIRAEVRSAIAKTGLVRSEAVPDKTLVPTKFEQYYDYQEPVETIPSHRYLAIRRGEREGILRVGLDVEADRLIGRVQQIMSRVAASPFASQLGQAVEDAYKRLIAPSVENDVRAELKARSDRAAVEVFADNLRNVLMAPPLGYKSVVAIDPGYRTGCKCAALDATGKLLDTMTIYPTTGDSAQERAKRDLGSWLAKYTPFAVAVGNGTAGRETESFARKTAADSPSAHTIVVSVNESGASVYSASTLARKELPDLDVSIRGAVSIGRRLQDPLSELVKVDPKAIGVGQYQHDVHQPLLQRKLDEVVESCVNHVGVDINTASAPLLSQVAGIGPSMAKRIISHRDANGAFMSRKALLAVSGLGPRTFEQAAGFLRIREGQNALDASAVHPERYTLVIEMAGDIGVELESLVGNPDLAARIDLAKYVCDDVGLLTLKDIVDELKKPGRDPRAAFEPPAFREDVHTLGDLKVDMNLEGVVTNVTDFGAFVDIGVHQDGLVHISQLADHFVRNPNEVVRTGDKLRVRVMAVDIERKRISLTARKEKQPGPRQEEDREPQSRGRGGPKKDAGGRGGRPRKQPSRSEGFRNQPFANLLRPKPTKG